jgi:hypothetical protein
MVAVAVPLLRLAIGADNDSDRRCFSRIVPIEKAP